MIYRTIAGTALAFCAAWLFAAEGESLPSSDRASHATNAAEARSRALLLHEIAHGALQVMHRDFFDEDDAHAIPSASLVDVFNEMEKQFEVKMKWLTVNTDVVNFEHQAETEFEKSAVKALASGEPFTDEATTNRYQFAGAIHLGSQCLKCHVKMRTSNQDRTAGLVISMPLASPITVP